MVRTTYHSDFTYVLVAICLAGGTGIYAGALTEIWEGGLIIGIPSWVAFGVLVASWGGVLVKLRATLPKALWRKDAAKRRSGLTSALCLMASIGFLSGMNFYRLAARDFSNPWLLVFALLCYALVLVTLLRSLWQRLREMA